MYYLQSRYYDPEVCRFVNADEYASTGQDFLGCNMFAYCNNNPVNCYDSAGTLPCQNTMRMSNDGSSSTQRTMPEQWYSPNWYDLNKVTFEWKVDSDIEMVVYCVVEAIILSIGVMDVGKSAISSFKNVERSGNKAGKAAMHAWNGMIDGVRRTVDNVITTCSIIGDIYKYLKEGEFTQTYAINFTFDTIVNIAGAFLTFL